VGPDPGFKLRLGDWHELEQKLEKRLSILHKEYQRWCIPLIQQILYYIHL
jgi:hypothetical protein